MISQQPKILLFPIGTLVLLGAVAASAADPPPAVKKAFLGQPAVYLRFEITETGTREAGAGTPKDALTDAAYRVNNSVKFEVPLTEAMPNMYPPSSMPMTQAEMVEPDRFIGWTIALPDDAALEEMLTTGKVDLATNPMFLPVAFAIDEVRQFLYRDTPASGFGTETTTSKGRGVAYIAKSGMVTCDLKKMACDIASLQLRYSDGAELVTVQKTSDVAGFEAKDETVGPSRLLPTIPQDLTKRFSGCALTLPGPSTVTFSGPTVGSDGSALGTTVNVKVTLSGQPAP